MPRAALRAPPPFEAVEVRAEAAIKLKVEHPRCAKCGHPATLGMMLFSGAGTGPWLCEPSSFPSPGRAGCRPRRL